MVPLNFMVDAKRKYDNVIIKFMTADGWLEKKKSISGCVGPTLSGIIIIIVLYVVDIFL